METIKLIGRISKKGVEYLQTAIHIEGREESEFIPVFFKKGVDKLNFISQEKKVDKRGVVYTLYEVDAKNVFFPEPKEHEEVKDADGNITKKLRRIAILTK